MKTLNLFWSFVTGSAAVVVRGNRAYYAWVGFLLLARHFGAPRWAAFLAATAFSFSGFQIGHSTQ